MCEKLSTANAEHVRCGLVSISNIMLFPHMSSARPDAAALNVPDVGIVDVVESHQALGMIANLNIAELLA